MPNNSFDPLLFLTGLLMLLAAVLSSKDDPGLTKLGTVGTGLILINLARKG